MSAQTIASTVADAFQPPRLLTFRAPAALVGAELLSFEGTEGLSVLYHFRLRVRPVGGWSPGLVDAVIGEPVGFALGTTPRGAWHGIVLAAELEDSAEPMLYLEVGPRLAALEQSSKPRVFRDKTVKQIVEAVLADHGITGTEFRLKEPVKPRELTVQQQENDADFILRLLEEAGYQFRFEHTESGHKLVVADHVEAAGTVPAIPLRAFEARGRVSQPFFDRRAVRRRLTSTTSTVAGHHPPTPDALLAGEHRTALPATPPERSIAHHLGVRHTPDRAEANAQARLHQQRLEAERTILETSGTYCLRPGEAFRFADAPTVYRARQVQHAGQERSGAQPGGYYATAISLIDDRPFRPARVTPRPLVSGWQPAVVVDRKGETKGSERVCIDERGRSFLRFRWGGTGSDWVVPARVAQFLTGAYGPPQLGDEVAVAFEDGNPDLPLVIGFLPTAADRLPHSPSAHPAAYTLRLRSASGSGSRATVLQIDARGGKERLVMDLPGSLHQKIADEVRLQVEKHVSLLTRGDLFQQARTVHIKAKDIVFEAEESITIGVGGSKWVQAPSAGSWQAGTLFLNSPGGPGAKPAGSPFPPDPPLK